MQRFFKSISPAFLRRIDHHLLINRPFIWATKIHHVLYWGLLGNLFAVIYAFLLPVSEPSPLSGTFVLMIPVAIGLVFWGKALQETGYWHHLVGAKPKFLLRNQFLFGLGCLLLTAIPVVYLQILDSRLQTAFVFSEDAGSIVMIQWLMIMLPLAWMIIELLAYMRFQQIIWTVGGGLLIFILELVVCSLMMMGEVGRSNAAPVLLLIFVLVQLFAFMIAAFNQEILSKAGRLWQSMCVVFSGLLLLILPILFWVNVTYLDKARTTFELIALCWFLGLLLAGTMWHLALRKRLMELQAQPAK